MVETKYNPRIILVVLRNLRSHYNVMTAHTIWHVIDINTKQKAKASHHHIKSLESPEEKR